MTDKNNQRVFEGMRCSFSTERGWVDGVVRAVRDAGVWAGHARVDDGDPENDDLHTNGFRVSAWVSSNEIEVRP